MLGALSTNSIVGPVRNRRALPFLKIGKGDSATPSIYIEVPLINSTATVPILIKGAVSQSANLLEIRNNSNALITKIDSSGFVQSTGLVTGVSGLAQFNQRSICISSATNAFSDRAGALFTSANGTAFSTNFAAFFDSRMGTGDGGSLILGNGTVSGTNSFPSASSPASGGISVTSASGTNIGGANLNIYAGRGTGTGVGGNLNFQVALATTSSSTVNTYTTVGTFSGTTGGLVLTSPAATTTPLTINLAASQSGNVINITSSGGSAGDIFMLSPSGRINLGGTSINGLGRLLNIVNATPGIGFFETGTSPDEGGWDIVADASAFSLRCFNDAIGAANNVFRITRSGYVPATMTISCQTSFAASMNLADGTNIVPGGTTGTKYGTSVSAKQGWWNATPVVQQVLATGAGATADNIITLLQTLGLCRQS